MKTLTFTNDCGWFVCNLHEDFGFCDTGFRKFFPNLYDRKRVRIQLSGYAFKGSKKMTYDSRHRKVVIDGQSEYERLMCFPMIKKLLNLKAGNKSFYFKIS